MELLLLVIAGALIVLFPIELDDAATRPPLEALRAITA